MRALEEVALSYDQKAEEAAKTCVLQKKLDDAELRSDKLSNVFILHVLFFILKLFCICERRFAYNSGYNRRGSWTQEARRRIGTVLGISSDR